MTPRWRTVALKDLLSAPLANGRSVETREGGFPVLRLTAIKPDGIDFDQSKGGAWSRADAEAFLVQRGDFLVSRGSGSIEMLGQGAHVVEVPAETAFPDTMIRVRTRQDLVSDRFLSYLWRSPIVQAQIRQGARTTAGIFKINQQLLERIELPLPALADQQHIVDTLTLVDAQRSRRRRAAALLDELTAAMFLDLFGDPATNPRCWPEIELGEIILTGPQNGLYKPASAYGSGTPIVRIDSFYLGRITRPDQLKRVRLAPGDVRRFELRSADVLINRVNSLEYLGKVALVPGLPEPTVFESNMMRLSVDHARVAPRFVITLLQDRHIRAQIRSAAKQAVNQASINQTDVRSFRLYLPPRGLQDEFVRRLEAVDSLRALHFAHLAELEALFASVQDRAFRGELALA